MSLSVNAPAKKSPVFTRDSFLKSPDWRWQLARIYNNAKTAGLTRPLPSDPKIIYAARLQKAMLKPKIRQFILLKMPDVYQICLLGTGNINAPLRCELLACFIYDLTPAQISQKLVWITENQAKLYQDLFFDLSGVQGLSGWFLQMLLQPIKALNVGNMFRARALAHYHSLEAALSSLRFGNSGKSAKLAMKSMWQDLRNKKVFDYMAKNLNVPVLVYAGLMLQAIKSVLDRDFAAEMKGLHTLLGITLEIASVILKGVRGFTQLEINQDSKEYKNGIDFANLYINSILLETKV